MVRVPSNSRNLVSVSAFLATCEASWAMRGKQGQQQPGLGQQFLLLQRLQALGKPQDQLGIAVALGILVSLKNGLVEGFKLVRGFGLFQQATALLRIGRP